MRIMSSWGMCSHQCFSSPGYTDIPGTVRQIHRILPRLGELAEMAEVLRRYLPAAD